MRHRSQALPGGTRRRHVRGHRGRADAGVRKVVAASSASIYGLAEEFPTTERHHPYANDTLYGAAKTSTRACCGASTPCAASTT